METNIRICNIRYKVNGLRFDAAVDMDWALHLYGKRIENVTPIELYCFDNPDWDIHMMYHKELNDEHTSCVDFDAIKKETRRWIKEMK